ncbi:hypothetical protein FB561_1303 [Kribbella amoyensis]|uniref:Uncharacterized protein n=1 Tax=Kribbella amoyensis TaxID=996641 RepID=A0A561BMY2_9ACTN|nr:hypothetical protein [Kribbella amoyensis]TWD80230.1 hypothetical protein FB561_1303 [Kribbella amoyensis]
MSDQHGDPADPDRPKPAEQAPPAGDTSRPSDATPPGAATPPSGGSTPPSGQPAVPGGDDPRPGPYQGVFGASGQQPPPPQYDPATGVERPGPYQGAFGQPGGPGPQGGFGQRGGYGQYGQQPPNPWGQPQSPYAYQQAPVAPPKQVVIASVIAFGLGGLCVLLGLFSLTAAGGEIAETLAGSSDMQGVVVAAILLSSVLYLLPAIFVRKRKQWARIMLIVVAAIGIAGGVGALPGSLIGLGLHAALLILMLQQPTKLWFQHR